MTSFSDGRMRYKRNIDNRTVLEDQSKTLHVFIKFFFETGDKSLQEISSKICSKKFKLPENPLIASHIVVMIIN